MDRCAGQEGTASSRPSVSAHPDAPRRRDGGEDVTMAVPRSAEIPCRFAHCDVTSLEPHPRAYATATGFETVNAAMRATRFTRPEQIRVPLTLAWAERDRLVTPPEGVPSTVRNIELPGVGRMPMWDAPDLVASLLLHGSSC